MKKIVVCPDSYKGCMSASEVAHVISDALKQRFPDVEVVEIPLADGGEGTADALINSFPLYLSVMALDPLGRNRKAHYYTDLSGKKGLIQISDIIGLPLLSLHERNPLKASSFGVGEVILDALNHGFSEITVALGGSATCDAGMGMLEALGFKFYDREGNILKGNGENLIKIASLDPSDLNPALRNLRIRVIVDVKNPLTGADGAVNVFAPQKGAKPDDSAILERGMENFVNISKQYTQSNSGNTDNTALPGAGAAGGLGFAFLHFLNVIPESGINFVLDELNFSEQIKDTDLIITGEGKADRQSLMGKVLSGVLKEARSQNIPVISISGKGEDINLLHKEGITSVFTLMVPNGDSEKECLNPEQSASKIKEVIASFDSLDLPCLRAIFC